MGETKYVRPPLADQGFTLLELVVAMAVTSFLVLTLTTISLSNAKSAQTTRLIAKLQGASSDLQKGVALYSSQCAKLFPGAKMIGAAQVNLTTVNTSPQATESFKKGSTYAENWTVSTMYFSPAAPVTIGGGTASVGAVTVTGAAALQYNTQLNITLAPVVKNNNLFGILTGAPTISIPMSVITDSGGNIQSCMAQTDYASTDQICTNAVTGKGNNLYPNLFPATGGCPGPLNTPCAWPPGTACTAGGGGGGGGGKGGGGGGGGGKGCFTAGTLVSTPQGNIPIEKLALGDTVYAYDEESGETVESVVEKVFVHPNKWYGEAVLDDGSRLEVTPVHRFYSPATGQWIAIGQLKVGDVVYEGLGGDAHLVPIKALDFDHMKKSTVYNLEITKYHNYYVEGVLVHNVKTTE